MIIDPLRRRILLSGIASMALPGATRAAAPGGCTALLDRNFPRLQDEKPQALCQYAGRVLLVVNTASYCGFTPQYRALETLYDRYRDRGLVVLGFPSNDFGAQEPGSSKDIADFCENTFGVRFPMFAKTRVVGSERNALYADLARITGQSPRWNFHKYVISRDGQTVVSYPSNLDPLDKTFVAGLEKLIDAR